MAKGIIYLMTTVVPGLVKIGKTGSNNFEQRMYNLEHDGYRNVTGLKREFAIEVDNYDEKERLLHTIFEKSQVSDTELFALDKDIIIQLLSSLEGSIVYPKDETKEEIFDEATDNKNKKLIPDGIYTFKRHKISDNKTVFATVEVKEGRWILQKGSIVGINEDSGVRKTFRVARAALSMDKDGLILEDCDLGECSPGFAGSVVYNQLNSGWKSWRNKDGELINIYRENKNKNKN